MQKAAPWGPLLPYTQGGGGMTPIVALYIVGQKYLISGMTAGAVKG